MLLHCALKGHYTLVSTRFSIKPYAPSYISRPNPFSDPEASFNSASFYNGWYFLGTYGGRLKILSVSEIQRAFRRDTDSPDFSSSTLLNITLNSGDTTLWISYGSIYKVPSRETENYSVSAFLFKSSPLYNRWGKKKWMMAHFHNHILGNGVYLLNLYHFIWQWCLI